MLYPGNAKILLQERRLTAIRAGSGAPTVLIQSPNLLSGLDLCNYLGYYISRHVIILSQCFKQHSGLVEFTHQGERETGAHVFEVWAH